jgi:hypothetical protein
MPLSIVNFYFVYIELKCITFILIWRVSNTHNTRMIQYIPILYIHVYYSFFLESFSKIAHGIHICSRISMMSQHYCPYAKWSELYFLYRSSFCVSVGMSQPAQQFNERGIFIGYIFYLSSDITLGPFEWICSFGTNSIQHA